MKHLLLFVTVAVLSFSCQSGKKREPTKKGCDTCPSLSNKGKLNKPRK